MRPRVQLLLSVLAWCVLPGSLRAARISDPLATELAAMRNHDTTLVWIFFTDKGPGAWQKVSPNLVTERSARRRTRAGCAAVDASDLPVAPDYVAAVSRHTVRVRHRSKWFNAVSAVVTKEQIAALSSQPCVASLGSVLRARRGTRPESAREVGEARPPATPSGFYGGAAQQLQQIRVPEVHDAGFTGAGVLVAHFDGGYALLRHDALRDLHVVAKRDFVAHDDDPTEQPLERIPQHGDATLSVLGGNRPGVLVGAAYGASFLLARTEEDRSETPFEEDNWVAGIEWADSLGADVSSTSLGYLEYPDRSWTWENMNGNTTVITRAADEAARRGIVVVNSAGNGGIPPRSYQNTLVAPADGDSVIAVGAVDRQGDRTPWSSMGPTANVVPRIKPDVMALGHWVFVASSLAPDAYTLHSGTSFACPLVAGVAALLLEARPSSAPMQIRDALRWTASQADRPDNRFGWGIVDAEAALEVLRRLDAGASVRLAVTSPNPFRAAAAVRYVLPTEMLASLWILDARGRRIRMLHDGVQAAGDHVLVWDGLDENGTSVANGVYFCRLRTTNEQVVPVRSSVSRAKLVRVGASRR